MSYMTLLHFESNHFVGCLKDVRLHVNSATVVFSNLSEGRDIQPCSKPMAHFNKI